MIRKSPAPTGIALGVLRAAQTRALSKYTPGGRVLEGKRAPRPITLRRADYEAQRADQQAPGRERDQ